MAAWRCIRRDLAFDHGVPPPTHGGDARGWRRLLEYRNALVQGYGPEDAKYEYRSFAHEIESIPPTERVNGCSTRGSGIAGEVRASRPALLVRSGHESLG
jgi:hypothetical protein